MTASKNRSIRLWLGLAMLAALTLFGYAEDFTFNIPIEFHNIHPNIKGGFVNVIVYTKDYVPAQQAYNIPLELQSRVTYGSAGFQIVNGECVTTLVVKMNAPSKTVPGKRAQDGFYYEVNMVLNDTYYDNDTAGILRMLNGTYGYDTSKPFVYWTSGKINEPKRVTPRLEKTAPIIKR